MTYLEQLAKEHGPEAAVRFEPNSSLYRIRGQWRYAEAQVDGALRRYQLVGVSSDPYLDRLLHSATAGATVEDLVTDLFDFIAQEEVSDSEVTAEEAERYVLELIDSQVLVPTVVPSVTGSGALSDAITTLRAVPGLAAPAEWLTRAQDALAELDRQGVGRSPEAYSALAEELFEEAPVEVDSRSLFKVDLTKPVQRASLDRGVIREVVRAVELLRHLTPSQADPQLKRFRERFEERYGDRQAVPLVEVLDEDVGIGFSDDAASDPGRSRLIADLEFPEAPEAPLRRWTAFQTLLLRRLHYAVAHGHTEIELTEEEIESADNDAEPNAVEVPDAFHVMAKVASPSSEALASGEYSILVRHVLGPSGARFLGRFAHLDHELRNGIEEHLEEEEACRPDAVFAEVVHLPNGIVGNIAGRPPFRSFEIPFLGRGFLPAGRQIPITDLTVSVTTDRILLWSERLGKEVVPRLTSAHNYAKGNLEIYRFLCALQNQSVHDWMSWSWGPLEHAPFLPRVRCGRLVLARAQWTLDTAEVEKLTSKTGADLLVTLREWRVRRRVPRLAVLGESDRELLVDFENILSIESFVDALSGAPTQRLFEMFPAGDELWTEGPEGRFFHELIVPFIRSDRLEGRASNGRSEGEERSTTAALLRADRVETREYVPGSNWLFAKIYTSPGIADEVIRDVLRPVARAAVDSEGCDRWFFIRYSDPHWHLRFRVHGPPKRLQSGVLPLLEQQLRPWIADGSVWRLCLDTYQPELNRYGGRNAMPSIERLFQGDSEAVAELVAALAEIEDPEARWAAAIIGLDRLFSEIRLDLAAKVEVSHRLRTAFSKEFRADSRLKRQIGQRHREHRQTLAALLGHRSLEEGGYAWILPALECRASLTRPAVEQLHRLSRSGCLTTSIESLAVHLAHMHVNRLMVGSARTYEMVLYELLYREYRGRVERNRAQASHRKPCSGGGS